MGYRRPSRRGAAVQAARRHHQARFTTMSDRPRLAAASRTVTGKAVASIRREGRIPAVVYGHGTASEPVSIDAHEFEQLRRHTGGSTLIDLTVDSQKVRPVLVHGVQIHPMNRRPLHVDLFVVRMTEELTVEVPLIGTGAAPAAENGGTLVHPTSTVRVRALPGDLPDSLTYDLASLTSYDVTITVADLVAPEGVTIAADPAEVVARVLAPRVEEVEAPVAAEAGEAAEAAPADEGATPAGDES
jgi:large subunit ribosomal protein L25